MASKITDRQELKLTGWSDGFQPNTDQGVQPPWKRAERLDRHRRASERLLRRSIAHDGRQRGPCESASRSTPCRAWLSWPNSALWLSSTPEGFGDPAIATGTPVGW